MNHMRQLIFKKAWKEHKIKLAHGCASDFGKCLKRQYKLARLFEANIR